MMGVVAAISLIIICAGIAQGCIVSSKGPTITASPTPGSDAYKKVIEYRSDLTAQYIHDHWVELGFDSHPMDGVSFYINWENSHAFDPRRVVSWGEMSPEVLSDMSWGHFTDNYVLVQSTNDHGMSWFDDGQWATIASNMKMVSRATKLSGAKGIMLDPEYYGSNPWKYDGSLYPGKSFAEVQSMVRQRGAQWMAAVQSECPDITLYSTFLMSMPMLNTGGDVSKLSTMDYALLPAFENGMLDVLSPNATIIDGNEATYYYRDTDWFYAFSNVVKNPPPGWIAPENMEKYRRQVQYGTAVWVEGTIYSSGNTDDYRSRWWQHNIYNSLATADEYVFFFSTANNYNQDPYWAGVAGPARDGFIAAVKKYTDGTPLGYDMHADYLPDRWAGMITVPSSILVVPAVQMALKGNNMSFEAPANVTVTVATAGSNISRIDFYLNAEKSGEIYDSSGEYTWNSLSPGSYEIIARVYDSHGNHGTSGPLRITVESQKPIPAL
jgi:phage baseplate assembly protein gpV